MKSLTILALPLALFASELSISRPIKASIQITPSQIIAESGIIASELLRNKGAITTKEKSQIISDTNKILDRVKSESFCKGGSYTLEPIYNHEESKLKLLGYNLFSMFSCSLKTDELPRFNALVNDMQILADNSQYLELQLPIIRTTIKDDESEKAMEKAQEELLKKALKEAEKYSQITQKSCSLQTMIFLDSINHIGTNMLKNATFTSMESQMPGAPVAKEETITIEGTAEFICK
ncbi:MAG: hypothetical protein ACTTJS_04545 [Wolinella sp.]